MVDLFQAVHVVNSHVHLRGRSDVCLIDHLKSHPKFASTAKDLSPAEGIETGVFLRPFEALHMLSYATRARYQDDLFDMYVQWGLLRYLGFFDLTHNGGTTQGLGVSEAGKRIVGNQRRVTSEELGIGFGAFLAIRWFEETGAASVPISVVDIDAALDDRYIFAAGSRLAVRSVDVRRADYLIIAHDPGVRSRYRVRALECKGTRTASYAIRQLASAVEQLGGITVGGRVPAGLAVSTIAGDGGVSYLAVDPQDAEEDSYEVTSNTIDRGAGFQFTDDRTDVSPADLANASVRASWATLADFGGNLTALERWAPAVMSRRLSRRPRGRTTFDTPFGPARGTSVSFAFEGRKITVRYGIDQVIDQRISDKLAESIMEAQTEFARRLLISRRSSDLTGVNDLYSATPDGSIFSLSVR